jgi:hypothetical protein
MTLTRTAAVNNRNTIRLRARCSIGLCRFWILDFGFWIEGAVCTVPPQSKIQNLKSKIEKWRLNRSAAIFLMGFKTHT